MKDIKQEKMKGVALIVVIGILSLLAIIATYFAINMQLEQKAAANYLNSVKARYIAEAGLEKAIADVRNMVKDYGYDSLITQIDAYTADEVTFGEGNYSITIEREDSKTDLNSATQTQLEAAGFTATQAANIIAYRDTYNFFTTIEEVKAVNGITDTTFQTVKSNITANSPIVRGGLIGKYYNDRSMNDANFVGKVIELGPIETISVAGAEYEPNASQDASFAGGYLISDPSRWGLDNFGVIWEGYLYLPQTSGGATVDYPASVTFYLTSDDGSRLYIDNQLVINNWGDHAETEVSGDYIFTSSGWHRIKVEYYDNSALNLCKLEWQLPGGVREYVPSENLGFYPPQDAGFDYNAAGFLKITSTGQLTSGTTILAESKLEVIAKVFGTWMQTSRSEFYAAWYSNRGDYTTENIGYYQGDYSDGWVRNVTWLDSTPDNASGDLEAGGYQTTQNALKLGYWDDFDEDVAYSVINLAAMASKKIEGPNPQGSSYGSDWWWQAYRINDNPVDPNYFAIDYGCFDSTGTNNRLKIYTDTYEQRHFELNYSFYQPTQNVFARTWTESESAPSERMSWRGNGTKVPTAEEWKVKEVPGSYEDYGAKYYYDIDDDGWTDTDPHPVYRVWEISSGDDVYIYDITTDETNGAYWQPVVDWMDAFLYPRGERRDPYDGLADSTGSGYYAILLDDDDWLYTTGDRLELNLYQYYIQLTPYQKDKVLAIVKGASSSAYKVYLNNGAVTKEGTPLNSPSVANFKFQSSNVYDTWGWNSYNAIWVRGVDFETNTTYWDNIRFIPDNGFLVSTPFYAGQDVDWGRLTWTEKTESDTSLDVSVEIRTATTKANLPTDDSGFSSYANGARVTNSDSWLQYKVTLSTTALDKDDYTNSGKTPIFEDITITYLPVTEIFYYREITE
jgi:hypothetical protein